MCVCVLKTWTTASGLQEISLRIIINIIITSIRGEAIGGNRVKKDELTANVRIE